MASAASRSADGITCEYRFIVIPSWECPQNLHHHPRRHPLRQQQRGAGVSIMRNSA